ncbi:MAG: bifunctional oligoribonuclease/PAP phosphatase NrnA [Leptolyngbyaceae cyanobacterium CSU_1_4]|nr:bifunctional oligoribonuclease/PAP phosphatase NrnA [Leptolyngbyaceae cyanobacterium CSU_1_4]
MKLDSLQSDEGLLLTTSSTVPGALFTVAHPMQDDPAIEIESIRIGSGQAGAGLSSRRLVEQKVDALRQVLEKQQGDRQLVILQDFPDPDALSCAWAYKLIAQQYEIYCDIVYAGMLSHQENIALVKLTGLPAQRWTLQAAKEKLSAYQGCVFVDNQGTTTQLMALVQQANLPIVAVIDHHSAQDDLKPQFLDIRPQTRATATIFTHYLQAGLLKLDSNNSEHIKCATALMHGLRSDTNRLMQAQEEDFMAAAYLSRFYDAQLLNAVLQASRSKRVMEVIERSLRNRVLQNNFSIAGVGYLRYDDRDAIPQAADFLVTEENVHTAVVYGIVRDEDEDLEIVIGSLRTNKLTLDPDEFIKETFGQDAQGRYFGGGRSMAGGFEIPMGFLSGFNENQDYTRIKWEVFDAQIKQKLFRLVNPQ